MTLQRYPVQGPWKGIVADLPSAMDDQSLDDCMNMFCRYGRIMTRPRWTATTPPPDGQPIRGMYTFQDILNNYHSVVLTSQDAYMISPFDGGYSYGLLTLPSGVTSLAGTGLPYAMREINQQLYFCNGSAPLMYSDGSQNLFTAGDVPGACRYLSENSECLIGVNWTEPPPGVNGTTQFPFRVRWSDAGNPLEWINAPGNIAGASDLIESGGALTGVTTVGRNTYILRRNGATVMYPTGNATGAFAFEPYMWSQPGWGNFYPYSLVTWGPSVFCITDSAEVLMFDGSNFNRLAGGKVRKALANDLSQVSGDQVVSFGTSNMGVGFDLEAYWISIPGPNIMWVHNLTEGTWQRMSSSKGWLTSTAQVAVL